MRLNLPRLIRMLNSFNKSAKGYLNNKKGLKDMLTEGIAKAKSNKGALEEVWQKVQTLFALCTDYANGSYTNVDRKTIVTVIGGLLYFISPLDLIPDFIFGLGLIDDVFIIGYIYKKISVELEKYEIWRDRNQITIHI